LLHQVDQLLDRLLPPRCLLCQAPVGANCCAGCRRDLPWLQHAGRLHAALAYEYPVDRLIARAKFGGRRDCARVLGEWLAADLLASRASPWPELIIPVPLHPRRLADRGYNQSEDIARPLAAATGARIDLRSCRRLRDTPEQSRLSASERRRNLRGAFSAGPGIAGRRVAMVDDVITTGSTMAALARSLLDAGAASVEAWAVARTQPGRNR